jgi:hypothetical protein
MLPTAQIFARFRHTKPVVEASNVLLCRIIRSDFHEPHTIVTLFFFFFGGFNGGYGKKNTYLEAIRKAILED